MPIENRRSFLRLAGTAVAGAAFCRQISGNVLAAGSVGRAADSPSGPQRRIRGIMVDAARVPESVDYYRRVIEFCAEWELNTLQFRLTDDQGSALRFGSVPDLVTHPDALSPEQMRSLVEFATSHGVDVIPEVESFGHTGYITRSARYARLLDDDPRGSTEFTGMIPVLGETLELFSKLYQEAAAIFASRYLHAGCDEVNWGGSAASRKALESKTRPEIWGEYLNSLNKLAQASGKQMIVWGDFVLHKEPTILARLDKNIVIMDWNYWDTNGIEFHEALDRIARNGSRGIGAPGLISYRWGPRAGAKQLGNIDAFAEAYLETDEEASLGAVLTNWVPCRYLQNSIWDGLAYAAVAFKDGTAVARTAAFRRFAEKHYGAEWNETWSEAFDLAYDAAPPFGEREVSPLGLHLRVPWSSDEQLTAALKKAGPEANPFTRLRSLLVLVEPSVVKNPDDFRAFALAAEYLEAMFWREAAIVERTAGKPLAPGTATALIQTIAERDRELAGKLSRDWDSGRAADAAAKQGPVVGLAPKDQLLYQWQRAAAYSSSLAAHPERFQKLVTAAQE